MTSKTIFFTAFLVIPFLTFAQADSSFAGDKVSPKSVPPPNDAVFHYAEFPNGGETAFWKFLKDNLRYPEAAKKNRTEGIVQVRFIIEADGAVSNVTVSKGVSAEIDAEATRLLQSMPNWKPGRMGRHTIRASYYLPIGFHFE